jgi:hypothetical protein
MTGDSLEAVATRLADCKGGQTEADVQSEPKFLLDAPL